jgi:hypothetical protein
VLPVGVVLIDAGMSSDDTEDGSSYDVVSDGSSGSGSGVARLKLSISVGSGSVGATGAGSLSSCGLSVASGDTSSSPHEVS